MAESERTLAAGRRAIASSCATEGLLAHSAHSAVRKIRNGRAVTRRVTPGLWSGRHAACPRFGSAGGSGGVCWSPASLARKLSMPIRSRMTEWCTTRSMAAMVVIGSLKMRFQSEKTRFVEILWNQKSTSFPQQIRHELVDSSVDVDRSALSSWFKVARESLAQSRTSGRSADREPTSPLIPVCG